jgi:hypothetical protein
MAHYRTALICRNGHVVTGSIEGSSEMHHPFCKKCGAATIATCPVCGRAIHGYYQIPGVIGGPPYVLPNYCHNCGRPYPWTQANLDSLRELVEETEGLSDEDRHKLAQSLERPNR